MIDAIVRRLPGAWIRGLNRIRWWGRRRYCPVCASAVRRFLRAGDPPRSEARCPVCGARERHRLAWAALQRHTDLFQGGAEAILHVAPEAGVAVRLRTLAQRLYAPVGRSAGQVRIRVDITRLPFAAESFDGVFCSHVLEHVEDDLQAMAELRRVLRRGGWALIMVPLREGPTVEDAAITAPGERRRLFGRADHLRFYGSDLRARLEEAGFAVEHLRARDLLESREIARQGIGDEALFLARILPAQIAQPGHEPGT